MLVTMNINQITIPEVFTKSVPKKSKVDSHIKYYIKHGALQKQIIITQKGMLVDGYCDYITAKTCNVNEVQCELNTKRLRKGYERNRKIGNRTHKREVLYNRQNGKCAICGKYLQIHNRASSEDYLTFDHVLPVCKGGSNGLINLQGLCKSCNYNKADK